MPLLILDHRILYRNSSFQVHYLFPLSILFPCLSSFKAIVVKPRSNEIIWAVQILSLAQSRTRRRLCTDLVLTQCCYLWLLCCFFRWKDDRFAPLLCDLECCFGKSSVFSSRRKCFFFTSTQKYLLWRGPKMSCLPSHVPPLLQVWRNCEEKPRRISCGRCNPELGENRTG